MPIQLPDFLPLETAANILTRMKANLLLLQDVDVEEPSIPHTALAPAAVEMANAAEWDRQIVNKIFVTQEGADLSLLDLRAGILIDRLAPTGSKTTIVITGTDGTFIRQGTQVFVPGSAISPAVYFTTDAAVTIAGGTATVTVTATTTGTASNVGPNTITQMTDPPIGVVSLTNAVAATGGTDEETDEAYLARYLQRVRSPNVGGSMSDYVTKSLDVPGVGAAVPVDGKYGPGTGSVALLGLDGLPASQTLIDTVLQTIVDPYRLYYEAETFTLSGFGGSIDATQSDDTGTSVKNVYNASGVGVATQASLKSLLPYPGIWTVYVRVKSSGSVAGTNLFEIGVWDVSTGTWAKISATSTTDSRTMLLSSQIPTTFTWIAVDFYWNGINDIQLRLTRQLADTTTTVWSDRVEYRSTFSNPANNAPRPMGARIYIEAMSQLSVVVAATITVLANYDPASVRTAVAAAVTSYIATLAGQVDNDLKIVRVGDVILDVPGVGDYTGLTLNGGTTNLIASAQQVIVPTSVTIS